MSDDPQQLRDRARYQSARQQRSRGTIFLLVAIVLLAITVIGLTVRIVSGAVGGGGQEGGESAGLEVSDSSFSQNPDIVMTLHGDEDTLVLKGEQYIEGGCHAVDVAARKDITSSIAISGSVDTNTVGDYEITYTATNDSGAQNVRKRRVHVVDDIDADTDGIPVMMYHWIYTDDDDPESSDPNYLHADKLEDQLEWLNENDYYYPSYPELEAYVKGEHSLPSKSVVLTFDDGEEGFLEHGIPLLNEYKVYATSFVIGDRDRTPKALYDYASEYVTFQSHSYGLHNDGTTNIGRGGRIYDLDHAELVEDSQKMQEMLGGYQAFAYPYGDVSDEAPSALQEDGVLCAFTINYGNVHQGDDPMKLNRVRVFGESSLDAWISQVKTGQ